MSHSRQKLSAVTKAGRSAQDNLPAIAGVVSTDSVSEFTVQRGLREYSEGRDGAGYPGDWALAPEMRGGIGDIDTG